MTTPTLEPAGEVVPLPSAELIKRAGVADALGSVAVRLPSTGPAAAEDCSFSVVAIGFVELAEDGRIEDKDGVAAVPTAELGMITTGPVPDGWLTSVEAREPGEVEDEYSSEDRYEESAVAPADSADVAPPRMELIAELKSETTALVASGLVTVGPFELSIKEAERPAEALSADEAGAISDRV